MFCVVWDYSDPNPKLKDKLYKQKTLPTRCKTKIKSVANSCTSLIGLWPTQPTGLKVNKIPIVAFPDLDP